MNTGTTNESDASTTVTLTSPARLGPTTAALRRSRAGKAGRVAPAAPHLQQPALERTIGRVELVGTAHQPGRVYTCDPVNHRIDVADASLRPLFSFGGFGSAPGHFKQPTDVALVPLGPTEDGGGEQPLALAVADRDNHRIQLFELDGALIACIDPWEGRTRHVDLGARAGWPYFRLNPTPQLVLPSRLEWRQGRLEVMSADGHLVALDLQLVLLPDFDSWLSTASRSVAKHALDHFRSRPAGSTIPESYLRSIRDKVREGLTVILGARA